MSNEAPDLRDRVNRLEDIVSDQQDTIQELRNRGVSQWSRRAILATAAGAAGAGAIVGRVGASDGSWGSSTGSIGTSSKPLSTGYIQDLHSQSVITDEAVIEEGHGFLGLPNHHVNYASGLSNEEISRYTLASGDVLELWRLECQLKGGGSNSNVTVEVFDATNASSLGSVTAGSRTSGGSSPIGTSGAGATILVRLSTGSNSVDIATTGITDVVKA